jgi:hypothetical protein
MINVRLGSIRLSGERYSAVGAIPPISIRNTEDFRPRLTNIPKSLHPPSLHCLAQEIGDVAALAIPTCPERWSVGKHYRCVLYRLLQSGDVLLFLQRIQICATGVAPTDVFAEYLLVGRWGSIIHVGPPFRSGHAPGRS